MENKTLVQLLERQKRRQRKLFAFYERRRSILAEDRYNFRFYWLTQADNTLIDLYKSLIAKLQKGSDHR